MIETNSKFMAIPPRHRVALEMLLVQRRNRDGFGCIGTGALRDEDEPFTLEQIVKPLFERGLIEDLTETDLGAGGQYFVRITQLGKACLGLGYMLRDPRTATEAEIKKSIEAEVMTNLLPPPMLNTNLSKYDPNEEKEAIA